MKRADRPPLTDKQSRILELVSMGMTDAQVARTVGIGTNTLMGYMRRIYSALNVERGANQRCRAVFIAHRLGLINIDDLQDVS